MTTLDSQGPRLPSFDYGLRSRLLLLLAVMLLPFIAFSAYQAYHSYDNRSKEILTENARDSREIADNVDELVQSTADLLIAMAHSQPAREQNFTELKKWFNEVSGKYPYYKNIIYVDMDGNIRAAAHTYTKPDGEIIASVKKTVYYKRSINANGIAYGDFMYSVLSNKPVIHITYPVYGASGRTGFIAIAFDLSRVQKRIAAAHLTKDSQVSVFDQNGTIIARSLDPQRWVGKCFKADGIKGSVKDEPVNIRAPGPDGIVRMMSFYKTKHAPWYVVVCFEDEVVRNQALNELFKQLALFIPLLLVAVFGWIWIGRDVDGLYKAARKLSVADPMTSLGSFLKFNQDLSKDLARAKRHMQSLSVLLIDVDNFKRFNEENGYQYGNTAMVQFADIVKACLRDTDFAYRYGGDEITLLLADTDELDAQECAERIQGKITESSFQTKDGQLIGLTVSIGVATYPLDASDADNLVQCAIEALFIAKENGGNKIVSYAQTLRPRKKSGKGG